MGYIFKKQLFWHEGMALKTGQLINKNYTAPKQKA